MFPRFKWSFYLSVSKILPFNVFGMGEPPFDSKERKWSGYFD
jgi:hypothetical protein